MAIRSHLLIVRNGVVRRGRVPSDTPPLWMFFGPARALPHLEARIAATAAEDHPWFADAGVLVDVSRQLLLVHGNADLSCDIPLRRRYVALLAAMWPGWTTRWVDDGEADLARHVGVDPDVVLPTWVPEPYGRIATVSSPTSPIGVLTTVRWEDGATTAHVVVPHLKELLAEGEGPVLATLRAAARTDSPWDALVVAYASSQGPGRMRLDPERRTLVAESATIGASGGGGLHIDLVARALHVWSTFPLFRHLRAAALARWPGWTFTSLGSRFEQHAALSEGRLRFVPRSAPETLAVLESLVMYADEGGPVIDRSTRARLLREVLAAEPSDPEP